MKREMFEKRLAFTVKSVDENNGHVSGIIDLMDRGYIEFDNEGLEFCDKGGTIVWSTDFIPGEYDMKNIMPLLLGLNSSYVERVYPDCC